MDLGSAPPPGTIALIVVTAAVSTLMGVFGKKAAESLMEALLRPIRSTINVFYRWIAPRNPLSLSMRTYRKHVLRSHLTRLENPIGPALNVPIEQAFAPLKLITSELQEPIDLFTQAINTHRLIVLGGPGTGKTTLMKSLITGVLRGTTPEGLRHVVPVFVVLRNLAKNRHTVEQAIVASFAEFHFPNAENYVSSALSQGKMLIVLDGLDEVGVDREYVAEQILHFCTYDEQRVNQNRLIVTCRENSYRARDLQSAIGEIVRVEPFSNHHMRIFLQGWPMHKSKVAIGLYGSIQNDPQIRDICRTPLLLTILTGLYLDSERFEIPSSRDRFYKAALEELLVQRPARRQIKQIYSPEVKRSILERVALDRLETASLHDDAEEFTVDVIKGKAAEVFGVEKFDISELVQELTEINGIIRPASDGSYTCAHRTFQEYFAARESRRRRQPTSVVSHFGSRADLIEVLYFYCGMMDSIPILTDIISVLMANGKWYEAGKCLLHSKEPIDSALIEEIVSELRRRIDPISDFRAILEVLSSLAQRREMEFRIAKRYFKDAIDTIEKSYGEKGASALESALATTPEAAMKVIPSLLRHESGRWRSAAVLLLRDIGTDEALDELVKLLSDEDTKLRRLAAITISGMIDTRTNDLRDRAGLLPQSSNRLLWPFDEYFPASIAIPIVESLQRDDPIGNQLVYYAVKARSVGLAASTAFQRDWRRVSFDMQLSRMLVRAGVLLCLAYVAAAILLLTIVFVSSIMSFMFHRVMAISFTSVAVSTVDVQLHNLVRERARIVVDDIGGRWPANASGVSRILPWNWDVEPVVPQNRQLALRDVTRLSAGRFSIDEAILGETNILQLSDISSHEKVDELIDAIAQFNQNRIPNGSFDVYFGALSGSDFLAIVVSGLPGFMLVWGMFMRSMERLEIARREYEGMPKDLVGAYNLIALRMIVLWFPVVFALGGIEFGHLNSSGPLRSFCLLMLSVVLGLLGLLMVNCRWPRNRLLSSIYQVIARGASTHGGRIPWGLLVSFFSLRRDDRLL